jgi:hypothetical protein
MFSICATSLECYAKGENIMTEYSAAGPTVPSFDYMFKIQTEKTGAAHGRINSEEGVYKAIREYFEQFEAELDSRHEIAMCLASFGKDVDFRPEKVVFYMPSLITFIGVNDSGEKVQLVQHISQLSYLLRAVEKLNEVPTRIVYHL